MYFQSNIKPQACEVIYLPPKASEVSRGRILATNQLLNTNRPQYNNQ